MEGKGKKQAKNNTATVADNKAAGKSSDRKPRSVSKANDKKGGKATGSKSKGRDGSKSPMGKKGGAGKSTDRRSSSRGAQGKKGDTGKQSKAQDKKKGKKDEVKEEEEVATLQPTRALSAYIYFSNEMVPKIKADEGIKHTEAMARAGEIWGGMSAEEKKKYDDLHDKDVARLEKQKKELKDKGYFIMADGTKSTDHEVPAKKKRGSKKKQATTSGKRKSVMDKSMRSEKAGKSGGKGKQGKSESKAKSDDDLDINSEDQSQEASVNDSD